MVWFMAWAGETGLEGRCTQCLSGLSRIKKLHIRAQAAGASRDKILSVESRPSIRINVAGAVIYGTKMKV